MIELPPRLFEGNRTVHQRQPFPDGVRLLPLTASLDECVLSDAYDFGLSQLVSWLHRDGSGSAVATASYMAPEFVLVMNPLATLAQPVRAYQRSTSARPG